MKITTMPRHVYLVLILLVSFLLVSCSTTKIYDKDGRTVFATSCSGASWIPCFKEAGKKCKKNGYDIISKTAAKENGYFSSEDVKELVFSCK